MVGEEMTRKFGDVENTYWQNQPMHLEVGPEDELRLVAGAAKKSKPISDAQALLYLNSIPEKNRHNADALLYANNDISRERALQLTLDWMRTLENQENKPSSIIDR